MKTTPNHAPTQDTHRQPQSPRRSARRRRPSVPARIAPADLYPYTANFDRRFADRLGPGCYRVRPSSVN